MRRGDGGQATVELVGLLPLLAIVAFAAFSVLAAGRASSAAEAAATAAAVAVLQERDGAEAARRSLSGWPRDAAHVRVRGGDVEVTVRPRVPLLAGLLTASAEASAGRRPPSPANLPFIRGGDGLSAAPPTVAPSAAQALAVRP